MVKFQIIIIFILIYLIKKSKNDCNKSYPILINNICYNTYCTENQFQNNECIISNSITRIQWLNNIISFGGNETFNIHSIQMPNKDIIFFNTINTENENSLSDPLIYGLKSTGEKYFYKIYPSIEIYSYYLNGVGLSIEDKQYLLLCEIYECKLFDLESNDVYNQSYNKFLQNDEPFVTLKELFTIINLNNKSKILFTYATEDEIYLSIINLMSKDLSSFEKLHKINGKNNIKIEQYFDNFKCFITTKKFIECMYLYNNQYLIAIYDESLNYLNNIFLNYVNFTSPFYVPINAIHLKNEIGAFSYYINNINNFSPLRIKVNELYYKEAKYQFKNIIPETIVSIDDYNYFNGITRMFKEAMIKITDNQFAYAYIHSKAIIILVIFDLYGNNDDNLLVRYYKINLILYNFINVDTIHLFMLTSFLGLGFKGDKEDNKYYSYFLIFGNSAKYIDNLSLDIYKENIGFLLELKNFYSNMDNNLFGYEYAIKISSCSDRLKGIRFFSINKNGEIKINELINKEDSILFDFTGTNIQIGEEYIIEISSITYEPEYNILIELYDKVEKYGEDFKNYYESKIIDEKKIKIKIKFVCHESTISCYYPNLTTKTIENDLYNLIYFSDFIYKQEENNLLKTYINLNNYDPDNYCKNNINNINKYNLMNNCINECPFNYITDSSNNCIFICQNENQYIFNSRCYDDCPEDTIPDLSINNQKICRCKNLYFIDENNNNICLPSSSFICDDDHPILDEHRNECLNYRVKYENQYYYECPNLTCISEKYENKKICEEKISNMKIYNGMCFNNYSSLLDNLKMMAKNNIKINEKERIIISVYSYNNYSKNLDELIYNNSEIITIDLTECLELFKLKNNLDNETDIFIVIIETPKIYSNETINRFDFELYFDNLTQINNLDICKDINMKVYSPIKNSRLIDVKRGYYFYEQGEYNIFNKNDKFYKDICSDAYIDDNDIILNDRYIDIYPHGIQICPKDCENLGINYTTNLFICNCKIKLKENDDYEYELMTKDEIFNYFKDFHNIFEYFKDSFNYKIFKCYKLLFNINNYIENKGIYIGLLFIIGCFIFLIIFTSKGYKSIRIIFHHNLKTIIKERQNNKNESNKILLNIKTKKLEDIKTSFEHSKNDSNIFVSSHKFTNKRRSFKITKNNYSLSNVDLNYNEKKYNNNHINNANIVDKKIKNKIYVGYKKNINNFGKKSFIQNYKNIKKEESIDNNEINELPFNIAKKKDNRNIFVIFFSIFKNKINLIQIILYPEQYSSRYLLLNIYLLNTYINLFLNCILYNDYAISQKYHNNGILEFITSLIISLLSNILTSILFYFINFLTNYHLFIENIIKEIKNTEEYFHIISKLFKVIKLKVSVLLIFETIFELSIIYYLFIFCIIYSKSINSFLLNCLFSQINSIIYSLCLCLLISSLRKISLILRVKRLYIISKYFNEHF